MARSAGAVKVAREPTELGRGTTSDHFARDIAAIRQEALTDAPETALAAAMIFLTACAEGSFDTPPSACPLAVEYSRAEQARVADELAALPQGTVIAEWLADYAVLREQVRACS